MYDPTKPYKKEILELIKQTWETPYVTVREGIVKKKFSYPEYHHTDGIGTKGIYHWEQKTFRHAVLDALAMNLNDLAVARATPYAAIDHLLLPEDDERAILDIVKHLSEECKKRDIALTGGETAIHNNIKGLEIGITMLGFVKRPKFNRFEVGDVLIGIRSNGLHSNGFTKVREVFNEYRDEFTKPTHDYLQTFLALDERFDIHGAVHITGGAFSKLKDLLYEGDAVIHNEHRLEPQEIFFELYEKDIPDEEMYKTFNCGIGFVMSVREEDADSILKEIREFEADVIGEVVAGRGRVRIRSKFSGREVEY